MDGVQQQYEKPPCQSGSIAAIEHEIVTQYGIIGYHYNQVDKRRFQSYPMTQPRQ